MRAEKETIDIKKTLKREVKIKEIDNRLGTLSLVFIEEKAEEPEFSEFSDDEISNAHKKDSNKDKTKRDFRNGDKVILQEVGKHAKKDSFNAVMEIFSPERLEAVVKLPKKYDANMFKDRQSEIKKKTCELSYDYEAEDIVWNRKSRALEYLQKGITSIPNLLRKINEPKELAENELVDIQSFYNESLDENQKEAVIKALSLKESSEILLIQGPPGTGKTTTITEIIKQYLKTHKHEKILIASQSNQAVDNVLEKIAQEEDKILRIGKDKSKMSEIAKNFVPEEVLNKIIKQNLERIKNNPIAYPKDNQIESNLKELQDNFTKSLQIITAQMAQSDKNNKKDNKRDLSRLFLKDIRLIFGTLIGISSWENFRDMEFGIAIIDEAGRALLSELLVPCIKARKIVLVGDHLQLAPVIDDEIAKNLKGISKEEATTSFFERWFKRIDSKIESGHEYLKNFKHRLSYNYRAEDRICALYSKVFYDNELKTAEAIKYDREHGLQAFKSSAIWLDTGRLRDKEDKQAGTGKQNLCNAKIIRKTLIDLKDKFKDSNIKDIGIITPYKAQMFLLKQKLVSIINELRDKEIIVDIGTVDSFQGSDRDMIIYDCVRSSKVTNTKKQQLNKQGSKIDFIADEKRLNVSLSRAKRLLIIVGDRDFLKNASISNGENPFTEIIEQMENNQTQYEIIKLEEK